MRTIVIAIVLLQAGCGSFSLPGPGLQDFEAQLPNSYKLYRASAHYITVLAGQSGTVIPAKVVELAHDDEFIIAKQEHLRRRSPENQNDTYEVPAGVFRFWIIDLRNAETFGPLTVEEFAAKRKELEVPETLMLHDVYDYKP